MNETKQKKSDEKEQLEEELEAALEETFPASDPFSVGQASRKPRRPVDRQPAPIDHAEVDRLARKLEERIERREQQEGEDGQPNKEGGKS